MGTTNGTNPAKTKNGCKMIKIGFVVENLSSGQIPYTLIKSTNKIVENSIDTCIVAFMEENTAPCITPRFARFHIANAFLFDGILIATSLRTASLIQNFTSNKKYYYINDLEYLRKNVNQDEWRSILSNKDIKKFARCHDHLQELSKDGYDIIGTVRDFDIDTILKLTDGIKNDN